MKTRVQPHSQLRTHSLPMRCPLPQHAQRGTQGWESCPDGHPSPGLEVHPRPLLPTSVGEAPSLTQEGRLRVGPSMSPSGDGPGRRPLPGLSGEEEEDLSEDQQKAAHQHLFHLQEEKEGQGCDKHNGRRRLGEVSGSP